MWQRSASERALAAVTAEARRSPSPELDWARLEGRIQDALVQPAVRRAKHRTARVAGVALAAAAVIGTGTAWYVQRRVAPAPLTAAAEPSSDAIVDGDQLTPEHALNAGAHALRVVHAGRAEWSLQPFGRAFVLRHDSIVKVRLDAGALQARVLPVAEPERFVVEVGDARVAVHGTVFTVELRGNQSTVTVDEGVVAVGPRNQPGKPATLLRAPARAAFELNGEPIRQPIVATEAEAHRPAASEPRARASASGLSVPPIKELTIGEVEAGVTRIVTKVVRCFEQNTPSSGDLTIRVRTNLVLDVDTQGNVSGLRFEPPLSPSVQACSVPEATAVRFSPAAAASRITRVLDLVR